LLQQRCRHRRVALRGIGSLEGCRVVRPSARMSGRPSNPWPSSGAVPRACVAPAPALCQPGPFSSPRRTSAARAQTLPSKVDGGSPLRATPCRAPRAAFVSVRRAKGGSGLPPHSGDRSRRRRRRLRRRRRRRRRTAPSLSVPLRWLRPAKI
jgi:hypothetical protein